ncbi:RNA polymerase sigma factor [Ruminococcus sp. CAG:379]|jgi:DNA-binding CsgD family transcriptional regulator
MWGCERMTNKQKEKIIVLRQDGTSYKEIAEQLDLSVNTVKSYCQRHEL